MFCGSRGALLHAAGYPDGLSSPDSRPAFGRSPPWNSNAAQEIGAILRDDVDSPDDDDESGAKQQSRYKRQSAGLPHLGDEATTNVLTDMGSLRSAEDGKSRRRRTPKH